VNNCLDPQSEAMLRAIPAPQPSDRIDAIYRITSLYNLAPSPAPRTFVFGTAEFGYVPPSYIANHRPLIEAYAASDNIFVITPSHWSRNGFLRSGADPNRTFVVPHGVDPQIFHPLSDDQRQVYRRQFNWDGFVFLSVGSMTGNKGIDLLFKAFAAVAARHSHAKLVLKGLDSMYQSNQLLKHHAQSLTPAEVALIQPRLHYIGGTLSFRKMAQLFQMADAYVAPYLAEAFALPVLEAIACGCPVICTAGGPTDDFTTPDFALRIESHEKSTPSEDGSIQHITVPNINSLFQQMLRIVEQPDITARARMTGPRFVNQNFTWKSAVDRLLQVIFPE
jgi:glycosyltransferase involved in cell wall biosynthesis